MLKCVCHKISFQQKQQQKTSKRRGKAGAPAERWQWQGATGTRAKPAVQRSDPASSWRGGDGEAENLSLGTATLARRDGVGHGLAHCGGGRSAAAAQPGDTPPPAFSRRGAARRCCCRPLRVVAAPASSRRVGCVGSGCLVRKRFPRPSPALTRRPLRLFRLASAEASLGRGALPWPWRLPWLDGDRGAN